MDELRKSGLYEIQDRESDQMKEMQLRYERKNAEKAKAMEVARRLKEMGMDTDFIKKATGLYVRDIKEA